MSVEHRVSRVSVMNASDHNTCFTNVLMHRVRMLGF